MDAAEKSDLPGFRPYLLRYALLQLRDRDLADDVVQETMLAAHTGWADYSGKSTRKTWLTGILKHKILDAIRRKSREQPLASDASQSEAEVVDALFDNSDHWTHPPSHWGDPEKSLESKNFWTVFEACSKSMPARTARAFMMRELMELSTEEICQELAITPTNLWVLLHRARLSLRECLDIRWFGNRSQTSK